MDNQNTAHSYSRLKMSKVFLQSVLALTLIYMLGLSVFVLVISLGTEYAGAFQPDDWRMIIPGFYLLAVLLALIMVALEYQVFIRWQTLPFGLFVLLKYLTIFITIDVLLIGINWGYNFLVLQTTIGEGIEMIADLAHTRYISSISIFLTLFSILLNIFKTLSDYLGPQAMLGALFGKYSRPREEDLTFIFIDLKSSTEVAEQQGNAKYSLLINRCFEMLTASIYKYNASVYQFVGDEAVLFWQAGKAQQNAAPIYLYHDFMNSIQKSGAHFIRDFDFVPHFRAAAHSGKVTATEIKSVRREIVYHGDVLNTCARIKEMCSQFDVDFLVSKEIQGRLSSKSPFISKSIGEHLLRGKLTQTNVFEITKL